MIKRLEVVNVGDTGEAMGRLGDVILEELRRLGWSQNRLARVADVGSGTVNKAVRGVNRPDVHTLQKIAKALNISVDRLFEALQADILSEDEKRRLDAVPLEQVDQFLAAMRAEIEQDTSGTLYKDLRRFFNRRKRDG